MNNLLEKQKINKSGFQTFYHNLNPNYHDKLLMFHSENNTEIMKSHIVSLYKRLLIFIVKLQAIIIQAIINIYCETTSDYYTSDY